MDIKEKELLVKLSLYATQGRPTYDVEAAYPLALDIYNAYKSPYAAYVIGYAQIFWSTVVPLNVAKGVEFLDWAARRDDLNALIALGDLYYKGAHLPKNNAKARELWTRAVQLGSTRAGYNLAVLNYYEANYKTTLALLRPLLNNTSIDSEMRSRVQALYDAAQSHTGWGYIMSLLSLKDVFS